MIATPTINGEQRTPGDCLRVAVAVAYGLDYATTPAHDTVAELPMNTVLAGGSSWEGWALANGMRWAWSWEVAPICLPRWIAVVDSRGVGTLHALAMEHDRLLLDPNDGHQSAYRSVHPTQIRRAMWLLPADAPDRFRGRGWCIVNPENTPLRQPGVLRHTPSPRRGVKHGRNDPCPCRSGAKAKQCCGA